MATFVLVHAAWGGAWEWRRVARMLQSRGHEVFTPTLTGVGERAHLAHAEVDLDTHIQDVVAVLATEELGGVVLVGHSYSGMVITGVMDRVPSRIAHGVYVDALLPRHGQALVDLLPAAAVEARIRGPARQTDDGWRVPFPFSADELDMTPEDTAWCLAHSVPQPLRTFEQPLRLSGAWTSVPAFTYIHCIGRTEYVARLEDGEERETIFDRFARRAQGAGWNYREIQSTHDPHITAPEALTVLLQEAAGQP